MRLLVNLFFFIIHLSFFSIELFGIIEFNKVFDSFGLHGNTNKITMLTFLTFWGQLILALFFGVSVLVDLIQLTKILNRTGDTYFSLVKLRDLLFRSVVFPIGSVITTMFWGIFLYDRELIFSEAFDAIFPRYLNHIQHTLPGIVVVIETLIVNHQYHVQRNLIENNNIYIKNIKQSGSTDNNNNDIEYTPITSNLKQDVANLVSFILFYLGILTYTRYELGYWVYPILEVIPTHSKIIFIFTSCGFAVTIYVIGRTINQKRWGGQSVFIIAKKPPPTVIPSLSKKQQTQQQQPSQVSNSNISNKIKSN